MTGKLGINILLVLILMASSVPASADEKVYSFGVVPQATPLVMHEKWTPFLNELSKAVGVTFDLKIYRTFQEFKAALNDGEVDFAFMTPIQQVTGVVKDEYIPLVRSTTKIAGILVVRKESLVRSISDLRDSNIAFVGEDNVCSILVRNHLAGIDVTEYSPIFAGSTDNIVKSVLIGKAQAGAFLDVAMAHLSEETREQLHVLMETEKIAAHPISANKRIPLDIRAKVRQAVLDMGKVPSLAPLLKNVSMFSPVRADYLQDYRPIEKYGMRFIKTP